MTADQNHVVLSRAIHLGYPRVEGAHELMDTVSSLWESELAAVTEEVFSACCPPDRRVQLERIAVDLGTVPAADLGHQLPLLYRAALRETLQRLLAAAPVESPAPEADGQDSVLAVLEYVLLHGYLPWWCPDQAKFEPARRLARALARAPSAVAELVRRIGGNRPVRDRIVDWLTDREIGSLIRALIGGDATFVLKYAEDLDRRQKEDRIVPASTAEFRHAKWEIILSHLLAERGTRFNAKIFLRQTIYGLAARFRLRYDVLLGELARCAKAQPRAWGDASLPQLLIELDDEERRNTKGKPDGRGPIAEDFDELVQLWRDALRTPPNTWSANLRTQLAFWRRVPELVTWGMLLQLMAEPGLAAGLAALCTPSELKQICELARLQDLWPALGSEPSLLLQLAADVEREPANVSVATWIDWWYHFLVDGDAQHAAHETGLTLQTPRQVAFWQALPVGDSVTVVNALLVRHGPDAILARLATDFTVADRVALLQVLLSEARTNHSGDIRRLIDGLACIDTGTVREGETSGSEQPDPEEERAALRHFLETGVLPMSQSTARWQARHEEWLVLALARQGRNLPDLLRAWARVGEFTDRMAERLPGELLEVIVEAVEPAHADQIVRVLALTSRLRSAEKFAQVTPGAFYRSAWKFTFDYLLVPPGAEFVSAAFLAQLVRGLSIRHGVEASDVLSFLTTSAEITGSFTLLFQLRGLARELAAESRDTGASSSAATSTTTAPRSDSTGGAMTARSPGLGSPEQQAGPESRPAADSSRPSESRPSSDALPMGRETSGTEPPGDDNSKTSSPATTETGDAQPRAGAAQTDTDRPFDAARLRRSPLARLQLLQQVLADDPRLSSRATQHLMPMLWQTLAEDPTGAWTELVRDSGWSLSAVDTLLHGGAESALESIVFRAQPAQAALWRESLAWFEGSAEAAALFPSGRDGLRARLWRALLESWREGGGRPIENVAELIARLLVPTSQPGGLAVRTLAGLNAWREALARDPSAAAQKLAVALKAQSGRTASRPPATRPSARSDAEDADPPAAKAGPVGVTNAGLVILAPFLPELFRRCDLLVDGAFRDFRANQYAVHLVQFLVTEKRPAPEHTLALNKVLCGLSLQSPVVVHIELREEDRNEARSLLASVARQWPRGASLSVDGLRASYLRREGWLERKEKHWLLRVERRGWDVLLEELAWSFPGRPAKWMTEPLQVEWI